MKQDMTTKQWKEIIRLNANGTGLNDQAIADQLGVSRHTVLRTRHRLGVPAVNNHSSRQVLYHLYDRKTGALLTKGTAKEMTAYLGLSSIHCFYVIASRASNGQHKKYRMTKSHLTEK